METQRSRLRSQKRPASPDSQNKPSNKKHKPTYNQVSINLTQRLAKAVKDVIVTNLNEPYREKCLTTIGADNGSEAGKKVEALIVKFKDSKKQKAIKGNSEKINENSP